MTSTFVMVERPSMAVSKAEAETLNGNTLESCPPKETVKVPPIQSEVPALLVQLKSVNGLVTVAAAAVPVRLEVLTLIGKPFRWIGYGCELPP